ncbi:MAG: NAD-binding oxidoreductase, partial [Paracoccaceae bacterium]
MTRLFSYANRPFHLGPYPLEKLARSDAAPDLSRLKVTPGISFRRPDDATSIVNAMQDYQAMLDATRDGLVKSERAVVPDDLNERARNLKSFAYFCDTDMVAICEVPGAAWRKDTIHNPDVDRLAEKLRAKQTSTLAAGIDVIMAGLRENMAAPPTDCRHHSHAIVLMVQIGRPPRTDEAGCDWLDDALEQRTCLRAAETAVTLASYIRSLGFEACAHSGAASDVAMERLAVASGLALIKDGHAESPFLGRNFGLAVITTTFAMACDRPLSASARPPASWASGLGRHAKSRRNRDPFARRNYRDGAHP